MNKESWAPRRARVFLALQFAGMFFLALSTIVASPLGLTLTIVLGFVLLLTGIVLAIAYSWHKGAELDPSRPRIGGPESP